MLNTNGRVNSSWQIVINDKAFICSINKNTYKNGWVNDNLQIATIDKAFICSVYENTWEFANAARQHSIGSCIVVRMMVRDRQHAGMTLAGI